MPPPLPSPTHVWSLYAKVGGKRFLAPSVGVIPGEPTDVVVTEATKSYVVLAWKPPVQRGHEGVMYYIEKVGYDFRFFLFFFFVYRLNRTASLSTSVCFGDGQLAEGEHGHTGKVSPLCHVRPGRGENLQLPRALL